MRQCFNANRKCKMFFFSLTFFMYNCNDIYCYNSFEFPSFCFANNLYIYVMLCYVCIYLYSSGVEAH